jgi:GT2 family glycosyltransferase
MHASVTAILVIRQGGEQLGESLKALTTQTRLPAKLILVDSSADSSLGPTIDSALQGAPFDWSIINVPYSASFSEAIEEGMAAVWTEGAPIADSEWVWLLRDDARASNSALERIALVVEGAPLIKIAGPKQRMADRPGEIREMGETMTRFGERMALAERERDQAQYDRLSDVLAVGEVGMLVHASTFRELGGFDPGLTPLDGGLDLGVRARLAGHRVVVVPRSVVYVGAGPADWSARKKLSGVHGHFLARQAWLYRRLVYAPMWALPVLLVWVFPWALARAAAQLFLKKPDRMVSEVIAALGTLTQLASVVSARRVVADHRVTSWATIDSLRLDPIDVRKRKAITQEASLAREEERAARNPQPPIFPSLPWLVVALTAVAGMVFGRWWGADYLQGGGLVPLVEPGQSLWDTVWGIHPTQWGFDAPAVAADPFSFVLALLGSITWWDSHLGLLALLVAALPIAGAIAWWGFSQLLTKAWTTTLAAFLWAVSPPLLFALADGRIGAIVALIALPWLLGTVLTAHESWQRLGQASLATVLVTAAAPSLWPLITSAVVVVALTRVVGQPVRVLVGFIPLVVGPASLLALPRFLGWWEQASGRWWDNWGVLFADPGFPTPYEPAPWWFALFGWPEPPVEGPASTIGISQGVVDVVALSMGVVIAVLALGALALGQARTSLTMGVLVGGGLISATIAPALFSGFEGSTAVFVWPGVSVGVILLGLLVGAGTVLDRVEFHDSLGNPAGGVWPALARVASLTVVALALVAPGLVAVTAWTGDIAVQSVPAPRTMPAFVAAEAAQSPHVGTLVIDATEDSYLVTLQRGSGHTLVESSTVVRGRDTSLMERDEDLARLAAMLVRPSAADPLPVFEEYGISFVLLQDSPDSVAALTLAQRPELVSASSAESGQLWQVDPPSSSPAPAKPAVPGLAGTWFLGLLAFVTILAIPTEKRARGTTRPLDDAVPTLGEETSDDL